MKLSEDRNAFKTLRKASWKLQETFETPAHGRKLTDFVTTIISVGPPSGMGSFTIGRAVMGPDHLLALFAKHALPQICKSGTTVATITLEETIDLLVAAFADPVDFLFTPEKKPFVLYADHDQFTTFFAQSRSNLNRVIHPLLEAGFKQVVNYERQL